jgi:hypothetical protein
MDHLVGVHYKAWWRGAACLGATMRPRLTVAGPASVLAGIGASFESVDNIALRSRRQCV